MTAGGTWRCAPGRVARRVQRRARGRCRGATSACPTHCRHLDATTTADVDASCDRRPRPRTPWRRAARSIRANRSDAQLHAKRSNSSLRGEQPSPDRVREMLGRGGERVDMTSRDPPGGERLTEGRQLGQQSGAAGLAQRLLRGLRRRVRAQRRQWVRIRVRSGGSGHPARHRAASHTRVPGRAGAAAGGSAGIELRSATQLPTRSPDPQPGRPNAARRARPRASSWDAARMTTRPRRTPPRLHANNCTKGVPQSSGDGDRQPVQRRPVRSAGLDGEVLPLAARPCRARTVERAPRRS